MSKSGLVYVYTGEGKGKTSAAIGAAVRAVGAGMKVGWVAWYKQASWKLAEIEPLRKLGVEIYLMGKGFHISGQWVVDSGQRIKTVKVGKTGKVVDTATTTEHRRAARQALEKAKKLLGKVDVLVLDEVNNAVDDKLIDPNELIDLISKRKTTHLILTGRKAKPEIVQLADLVTEMKKIKHPYDEGMLAVRGLDF